MRILCSTLATHSFFGSTSKILRKKLGTEAAPSADVRDQQENLVDFLARRRSSTVVIDKIPKSARITATESFTIVVKRCVEEND